MLREIYDYIKDRRIKELKITVYVLVLIIIFACYYIVFYNPFVDDHDETALLSPAPEDGRVRRVTTPTPIFLQLQIPPPPLTPNPATTPSPPFQPSYPHINRTADSIAILLMSCNLFTISRTLDLLVQYRPSTQQFPILVAQGCDHNSTIKLISTYKDVHFVFHKNWSSFLSPFEQESQPNNHSAKLYRWILNLTFNHYGFQAAVVLRNDLLVSPDFYEYFSATLPILKTDPTLWCVSAWNDNGKLELVDVNATDLLYRTDSFPGMGWMLTKKVWLELEPEWPDIYWETWMQAQRKGRSCIRPELSRTKPFGWVGVSGGQLFDMYYRFIYLNEVKVNFTHQNLTYLKKENYDPQFMRAVQNSTIASYQELIDGQVRGNGSIRIQYNGQSELQNISKSLGLVYNLTDGVLPTAYQGSLTFMHKMKRIFLVPVPSSLKLESSENSTKGVVPRISNSSYSESSRQEMVMKKPGNTSSSNPKDLNKSQNTSVV